MRALIYDDCQADIANLQTLLKKYSKRSCIEFDIDLCNTTEYLYNNIDKYDFLFLDIEIGKENGIDIGKNLIKLNHNCRIIITSQYKKYLIQGYGIHADQYFLKPIQELEFNLEMDDEMYFYNRKYSGFYDDNISKKKILFSEILYIDVYDRKTRIHFKNGKILSTHYTLKEWKDLLDKSIFVQTHKSYILNLFYVSAYSKQDVYLINNEKIPVSRNMKKHFEDKYIEVLPRIS